MRRTGLDYVKRLACGAALAALALGPMAAEQFDPMRVVYLQQAHPVMMLVVDRSGSTTFPVICDNDNSNYSNGGGYMWYLWKMTNGRTRNAASINLYGDESIDTSASQNNFRTGQGEWVRAASMNGKTVAGSLTWMYVAGNWGWQASSFNWSGGTRYVSTLRTVIDVWNMGAADNGTYVLSSAPANDGDFWYFNASKVTGNIRLGSGAGTYYLTVESSAHTFAAASTQVMMATATCTSTKNLTYTHNPAQSLWYFLPPSRMAVIKNAMGNSITIYAAKATGSMTLQAGASVATGTDNAQGFNKTYYTFTDGSGVGLAWGSQAGPWNGPFQDYSFDRIIQAGAILPSTSSNLGVAPDPNFTVTTPPQNVVGSASAYVNFGLIAYNQCSVVTVLQQALASDLAGDQAPIVTEIQRRFGPVVQGGSIVGLNPNGATPTRQALTDAGTSLQATLDADTSDCARTYAVLLVTDGQSNCSNDGDHSWRICSPPGTVTDCCSTSAAENDSGTGYPPESANTLWSTGITKNGVTRNVRTYVVGVSPDVSPCELNRTAYRGRTDAFMADVGFNTSQDWRLPSGTPGDYDWSGVNSGHHYAFFTNTTEAFVTGVRKILATMGAGDYTTSPPVVAPSAAAGGNVSILGSTEFSSLKGHLHVYDVTNPDTPLYLFDCGEVLAGQTADSRKIYTWNPVTSALVEVTSANAATLDTLGGFSSVTFAKTAVLGGANRYPIIDFVRGKYWDATANAYAERSWKLGPILNTTPAVVLKPENWQRPDLSIPSHSQFELDYADRRNLVYTGSSDGMMHIFDLETGAEVLALIPPNCLSNQPALFYNFVNNGTVTGQPVQYEKHIYGVSNSPRYSDIAFPGAGPHDPAVYKTVLFITEGPGGNDTTKNSAPASPTWPVHLGWAGWAWPVSTAPRSGMYAIDVTHPAPTDVNGDPAFGYDASNPVAPLSYVDSNSTDNHGNPLGLKETWSIPAIGCYAADSWGALLGSGRNALSKVDPAPTNQVSPFSLLFDPTDTTNGRMNLVRRTTLTYTGTPIVGDQAFADAIVWHTTKPSFSSQWLVDEGVVADFNGRLWFQEGVDAAAGPGVNVGANQPIYYAPAAGSWLRESGEQYNFYAFASGTFYETAPVVTGAGLCSGTAFCPRMYITALNRDALPSLPVNYDPATGSTQYIWGHVLNGLPWVDSAGTDRTTSVQTQVVSSPFLLVSSKTISQGAKLPFALFLLYDSGSGACAGDSFVLEMEFNPALTGGMAGQDAITSEDVFHASTGVAGGMAVAGESVLVSISGVGEGTRASVIKVPNLDVAPPGSGQTPVWWIELK
jgi:hypothetical protein